MKNQIHGAFLIAILTAMTLACSEEASIPTSPTEANLGSVADGPDGGGLKVTAPTPVSPAGGIEIDDDDPDLVLDNATSTFVHGRPLAYVFEVFDANNRMVYQSAPQPEGSGGRTSHEIGRALDFDKAFTWRAYATYESQRGPVSSAASFRTFNRFGVSCAHLGNELAIVQCRRAQYGFMSVAQRVEFLRRIAYDLNRAPAEHAPYGILVKSTGHSCNGYSCDVICSNSGMHRQWDVLSDEDTTQAPVWSRIPEIAVRPCEAVE
jgi:hypothetical protein